MSASPVFLRAAKDSREVSELWKTVLQQITKEVRCDFLAAVRSDKGEWALESSVGAKKTLPSDLLAETLDRGGVIGHEGWLAGMIPEQADLLLIGHFEQKPNPQLTATFASHLEEVALARSLVERREHDRARIERLQAILGIAAQWNRTQKMEQLLQTMAETSTRLLNAERASIFLWDRAHKMLVGRPALGVEGGELRIADTTGIVGQVIHSGRPARVDQHANDA